MFRIRTVLATAAVAVAAALALAAPASAHDEIVSSTPAADEQLTAAPEEVVLTFSNNLLSLDGNTGAAMTVIDDAGKDWVAGDPVVAADTLTVPLQSDMPNGSYDVTWKVVSSDGHPTDGEYSFSIAVEEAPATPEATESAEPSAEPTPAATLTHDLDSETAVPGEQDSTPWPLLIGLGVVVLAAIVLVVVMAVRKKRS